MGKSGSAAGLFFFHSLVSGFAALSVLKRDD
jgi:hypothetical protein